MAHGIETDNKRYKHLRRDDEKWLFEDLYAIKNTIRKYIARLQYHDENETDTRVKQAHKKTMTIDRMIAIILLGIFGSLALLTGIFLIIKGNYVVGVMLGVFGTTFVIAFVLYEKYR